MFQGNRHGQADWPESFTRAFARDHGLTDTKFSDSVRRMRGKEREEEIFGPSIMERSQSRV